MLHLHVIFTVNSNVHPHWLTLRNVRLDPEVTGSLTGCESEIITCHGLEIETPSQIRRQRRLSQTQRQKKPAAVDSTGGGTSFLSKVNT